MRRAVLISALLALLVPTAALAAHPRASFNDVENEVMCDTCNVPLNVAESPRADQERREIHQLIDQGLTKAQIKDRLKAEYGPDILALPQQSGFSLAAYLVPVAVVAALLALMAVLLPRWRRRPPGGGGGGGSGDPVLSLADARRLEEDLARHDV